MRSEWHTIWIVALTLVALDIIAGFTKIAWFKP
jgi:hypothetical protein